jgi:ribosomal protein S14
MVVAKCKYCGRDTGKYKELCGSCYTKIGLMRKFSEAVAPFRELSRKRKLKRKGECLWGNAKDV